MKAFKYKTVSEYDAEIARVVKVLESTQSDYIRRDYTKYLKRLLREKEALTRTHV